MMDEPNYHLTDSNGNLIGTIGATSDGDVVVEHANSGTQVTLDETGIQTPALSTGEVITDQLRPSSSTNGLTIEANSLADDSSASISRNATSVAIVTTTNIQTGAGIFFQGFDTITTVDEANMSNQGGDTSLSGTTGPDGSLNVAVQDNEFYIENRTGSEEDVHTYLFGV